jgi:hypothetical protein
MKEKPMNVRNVIGAVAALSGLGVLGVLCGAFAQDPPDPMKLTAPTLPQAPGGVVLPQPPRPAEFPPGFAPAGNMQARARIKVFRLTQCDPSDVAHLLESLLPENANAAGPFGVMLGGSHGPLGGGAPGVGRGLGGLGGFGGAGGAGAMPPPGLGGGGGLGGGVGNPNTWRITVEPRTQSVIVRGSEHDLQVAHDLIAIVETPDDKPLPAVKNLRAFRLKHVGADVMTNVIEELEMGARVVSAPLARLLFVAGSEDVLRDVSDMVKELDVESKKPDKSAPPKRLISGDVDK